MHCDLYLQCCSHICSVIYANNMKCSFYLYSAPSDMVEASDIYGTYIYICPPERYGMYVICVGHCFNLFSIFGQMSSGPMDLFLLCSIYIVYRQWPVNLDFFQRFFFLV